jgi:hypothetical protein
MALEQEIAISIIDACLATSAPAFRRVSRLKVVQLRRPHGGRHESSGA